MNKLVLEWSDIEQLVEVLDEKVLGTKIRYIHGIERGGLIPAIMLSHRLNIPYVSHPELFNREEVLIVDDIADSGITISRWDKYTTAVLHYKPHTSICEPTFYVTSHTTDDWIVYPWEHPQAETIQDYKLDK